MFAKWKIYFKSKMKDEEWGLTNILLWTAVLNEFGVTEQELIEGTTKACFARELNGWPPTTATDFINIFRTETASNYPDMKQAYLAAANGDYKHEVALETAKRVGSWELKTQPESVSYKSWQKHYVEVCEEHSQGKDFKVPETHRVEHSHAPVQAGSEADKRISEKLAELRRMAV